jgi:hypothetical protein
MKVRDQVHASVVLPPYPTEWRLCGLYSQSGWCGEKINVWHRTQIPRFSNPYIQPLSWLLCPGSICRRHRHHQHRPQITRYALSPLYSCGAYHFTELLNTFQLFCIHSPHYPQVQSLCEGLRPHTLVPAHWTDFENLGWATEKLRFKLRHSMPTGSRTQPTLYSLWSLRMLGTRNVDGGGGGEMRLLRRAVESKGRQNGRQNEYFKWKHVFFGSKKFKLWR